MILHGKAMAPIAVRALSVAYRGETALWNVNWTVASGRITAIVGPNGAGKSTLLNAITGLVPSLAGEASFWGQSFADARRRIAYVPQRESVDWDFPVTAREVVEMGARRDLDWVLPGWMRRALKGHGQTFDHRVDEALSRVQMTEYGDRPIGELSGGQQQRIFLARALAQDADLLLLDEPFAGVDVTTEAILTKELHRLAEQGRTIVVVHHDLDDVAERFDDVVVLDGTVVASGPARATMTPELIGRVFGGRAAQGVPLVASAH